MSNRDKYWDDAGCANALADALHSDAGVPQEESRRSLYRACVEEKDLPDPDEVGDLVMGGDDGEVPPELAARFPHIHAALGRFF